MNHPVLAGGASCFDQAAQLLQLVLEVARAIHLLAVAVDGAVLQADVDAHGIVDDDVLVRSVTVIDQQMGEPLAGGGMLDRKSMLRPESQPANLAASFLQSVKIFEVGEQTM